MDPQQRLLLEVSHEAIEDAGIKVNTLAGSKTAVVVGVGWPEYGDLLLSPTKPWRIGPHSNTGMASSISANRISFHLDLKGPSFSLDTACSSALTAMHLACQFLWNGEAEAAIVGTANLILRPETTLGFKRGGFLSPDFRCRAFDSRANGFVRSEGGGAVFLKPLSKAKRDGDRVYAVVLGTQINQDGRSPGITMPDLDAQVAMLQEAYERAGCRPEEVGFVEAHGTGTKVGDPVEARAIGNVIGRNRREACYLGSVKTNLGHLEVAAGIAGFIKAVLSVKHRLIPGNLHFENPNPEIPFDELRLQVPTEPIVWPAGRAIAGINSFGFGGSNAHVIVAEYSESEETDGVPRAASPLAPFVALSARTPEALRKLADQTASFLEKNNHLSLLLEIITPNNIIVIRTPMVQFYLLGAIDKTTLKPLSLKEYQKYKEGWKLFEKYFFHLWD
jgi:acyl transferase domain-containing protein